MAGFEVATAILRTAEGRYQAEVDPQWSIGTKPNGGYLMAMLARAAVDAAGPDHPHPTAVSAHYLAAPPAGPAELHVETLRVGRSAAQLRASLHSGGRRCVEALVTCGPLPDALTPWWDGVPIVALPPDEECVRLNADDSRLSVALLDVVSERVDPACLGFAVGRPSGQGEIRGWVRPADGTAPDPLFLLVAADCLPPATFELGLVGSWVPTIEMTVYLRAVPAPGPLRVRLKVRLVAAGRVDEECDVWDSTGALVATGRQLAGVRLPDAPAGAATAAAGTAAD